MKANFLGYILLCLHYFKNIIDYTSQIIKQKLIYLLGTVFYRKETWVSSPEM